MKITLELPNTLMRRVGRWVVDRRQTVKGAIAHLLQVGMAADRDMPATPNPPVPVRLKERGAVTLDDIEDAVRAGRD